MFIGKSLKELFNFEYKFEEEKNYINVCKNLRNEALNDFVFNEEVWYSKFGGEIGMYDHFESAAYSLARQVEHLGCQYWENVWDLRNMEKDNHYPESAIQKTKAEIEKLEQEITAAINDSGWAWIDLWKQELEWIQENEPESLSFYLVALIKISVK